MRIKGFSLIELLVVISIIGVLAAIAIPTYQQYITRAKIIYAYQLLESFSELAISTYERTGAWPASLSWNGTTFNNGTMTTTTSQLQTAGIYYGEYAFNNNVAAFFVSISGLHNIPGYTDPITGGAFAGSQIAIRVKEVTGTFVTQCGTGVPNDPDYIPLNYQPSNCTCANLNDYFTGGTICKP